MESKKVVGLVLLLGLAFMLYNATSTNKAKIRGYVEGCFDTHIDIYNYLGLKERDNQSLWKYCEEKWALYHGPRD